jgi:hypothetical protein
MWQLCGWEIVDIYLAVQKIVKSTCNGIKKDQMHAYEMSYKCQPYPTHTVATYIFVHSCHTYPQSF